MIHLTAENHLSINFSTALSFSLWQLFKFPQIYDHTVCTSNVDPAEIVRRPPAGGLRRGVSGGFSDILAKSLANPDKIFKKKFFFIFFFFFSKFWKRHIFLISKIFFWKTKHFPLLFFFENVNFENNDILFYLFFDLNNGRPAWII